MEVFDWEQCKRVRNERVYEYLFNEHKKPLSEEEYVSGVRVIQRLAHGVDNDKRPYNKRKGRWSKCVLRNEYRSLKEKFGFFKGV